MLRLSHYAVATVRVDIHSTKPKWRPAGIRFQYRQAELGKTLQNSSKDKLSERSHVVVGKSHRMIKSAKGHRIMVWVSLSGRFFFDDQISERLKSLIPIFAVNSNWDVQLGRECP